MTKRKFKIVFFLKVSIIIVKKLRQTTPPKRQPISRRCSSTPPSSVCSPCCDADCSNNTRCIAHRNYGKDSTCETHKYCLILDNLETRCGGSKAPKCSANEYCAYGFVASSCKKCPCYGSHQAACIRKQYNNLCSPDSIVRLDKERGYTCDSCTTAASVLTGMT
ncbi:hypothetical protein HPB50_012397 [Hyalomma asiaticum]|uniref:Uncharacterized protein n=1 Tax=Hyalomma asiaticum TaxID=266040 RepID=A0ACB7RVW2_HYAAI|nr:hypothetical protein HPB50_012397 [Hyalomma asiaticum]